MRFRNFVLAAAVGCTALAPLARAEGDESMADRMPENLYKGELLTYPGPWAFQIPRAGIILVTDQELIDLADPDKQINLTLGGPPRMESLRQVCERAKAT